MSVRICYVEREQRGAAIRRLRLVGQTSVVSWPASGLGSSLGSSLGSGLGSEAAQQKSPTPAAAAQWITSQLNATRDTRAISLLCLDTDGATCCWISSPSEEPSILNVVARNPASAASEGEGARGSAAVDFYAPGLLDSSLQALPHRETAILAANESGPAPAKSRKATPAVGGKSTNASQRRAVLAMTDVPARLLIDALDKAATPVESVASFWHVMALAWDPGWSGAATISDPLVTKGPAQVCATIVIDPGTNAACPRLLWCWSRSSQLLVAGSMRLRTGALSGSSSGSSPGSSVETSLQADAPPLLTEDEAGRLTAEWLGWSAQISCAPKAVTCIMPEGDAAMMASFGEALARLWPACAFDALLHGDPIDATLQRAANRLEQTPQAPASGGTSLTSLAGRHGRAHRKLYVWAALSIVGSAVLAAAAALQFGSLASDARARTQAVMKQSAQLVTEYFPDAKPGPGYSLLMATNDEVLRLRSLAEPPRRTEPQLPILDELTTISMVVGNAGYALETLDLEASSSAIQKMSIVANSLADAEAMTEALNSIAGSKVERWTEPSTMDVTSRPGKYKVNYTAKWLAQRADKKAEPR